MFKFSVRTLERKFSFQLAVFEDLLSLNRILFLKNENLGAYHQTA